MIEYFNPKSARQQKLLEIYCNNEILSCPDRRDTDPKKIYKLSILESLYSPRIQEDFILLHHLKQMYDVNRIEALLRSNDLLYLRDSTISFGYNISFELFILQLKSKLDDSDSIEIFLDPNSSSSLGLEYLQIQHVKDNSVKSISMFSKYASMTVHFVNGYREWSTKFHEVLDDFLKHLYN